MSTSLSVSTRQSISVMLLAYFRYWGNSRPCSLGMPYKKREKKKRESPNGGILQNIFLCSMQRELSNTLRLPAVGCNSGA